MMDFGVKVKCHRCTKESFMYYDTHGTGEWGKVAGPCPWCGATLAARVGGTGVQLLQYPTEHPRGVIIIPLPYYEPEATYADL